MKNPARTVAAPRRSGARGARKRELSLAALLARHRRGGKATMRELLKSCGPTLSEMAAAKRLGVSVRKIRALDRGGQLLSFNHGAGFRYPAWQFDASSVRPWVAELIALLGRGDPALHWILVGRTSCSVDGEYQSFLTRLLANDPDAAANMLGRARAFVLD